MANEFTHKKSVNPLTQAQFEATDEHVFDSQATGDIPYASSTTQITRLPIGATGKILSVASGIPSWVVPGAIGASAYVIANGASTAIKTWATILQTAGYLVWVCNNDADEVEILAAIDALPSGGGRVLLSEGTFLISDSIAPSKDYVEICGQGPSTIIKLADNTIPNATGRLTYIGSACPVIYSGHPDDPTFYDHITIRNLQIDGNTANQGAPVTDYDKWYNIGIFMLGCDYWTLENIEVINCGSGGIYAQGTVGTHTYGHKFSNVRTRNNGKNGVTTWEGRGGIYMEYTDKCQFTNVDSYDNQGSGTAFTECDDITGEILAHGNGLGGVALQGYGTYLSENDRCHLKLTALSNALAGVRVTGGYHVLDILTCLNTEEGVIITTTGGSIKGMSVSNGENGLSLQTEGIQNVDWTSISDGNTGIQLNACSGVNLKPVVYLAGWYGLQAYGASHNSVLGGIFQDNGQAAHNTYADIGLEAGSDHNRIIGCDCQATLGNKVVWNINEDSSDYNIILGNDCSGGVSGTISVTGVNSVSDHNIS